MGNRTLSEAYLGERSRSLLMMRRRRRETFAIENRLGALAFGCIVHIVKCRYVLVFSEFLDGYEAQTCDFRHLFRSDTIIQRSKCNFVVSLLDALFTPLLETFTETLLHAEVPHGVEVVYE